MPALYSFGTGFAQRIVDQQIANQEEETLRERAKLEFDYSIKIADANRSANSSAEQNKLRLQRKRIATSIMTNGGFYQISQGYQESVYNSLIGMDIPTLNRMSEAALAGDLSLVGMLTGRGATIQPAPNSLDALQTRLFNQQIAGIPLTDIQQGVQDLLRPAKDILNPMATFQKSIYSLVFAGPGGMGLKTTAPSYPEWVNSIEDDGWKTIKTALDESLQGGLVKSVEGAGEALGQLVEKARRIVQPPEEAALEDADAKEEEEVPITRETSALTTAPAQDTATVIGEALTRRPEEGLKEEKESLEKELAARTSPQDDPEGARKRLNRLAEIKEEMRGPRDIRREIMKDLFPFFPEGVTAEQAEDPAVLMKALNNLLKSRGTTLDEVRKHVADSRQKRDTDDQIREDLGFYEISDTIISMLMR